MSYRYQITVSDQAQQIIEALEKVGIYGTTGPEIIKRIVDQRLADFLDKPWVKP